MMQKTQEYIQSNQQRFLDELLELLRIPSISANSDYVDDMIKTADLIVKRLEEIGVNQVQKFETKGHPIVYGEKIFPIGEKRVNLLFLSQIRQSFHIPQRIAESFVFLMINILLV